MVRVALGPSCPPCVFVYPSNAPLWTDLLYFSGIPDCHPVDQFNPEKMSFVCGTKGHSVVIQNRKELKLSSTTTLKVASQIQKKDFDLYKQLHGPPHQANDKQRILSFLVGDKRCPKVCTGCVGSTLACVPISHELNLMMTPHYQIGTR